MRKRKWLLLAGLLVALALVVTLTVPVFAAETQDVTVTAVPSYITISNDINTWTLNGITGGGFIDVDTYYWSNPLGDTSTPSDPVVDGECRFTIDTTGSSVAVDLSVTCENFTGSLMDNSETGENGAATYGGYSYTADTVFDYSTDKVIMKLAATGSDVLIDGLAKDTTQKWGAGIETRTNAWDSGTSQTATMTIKAVEDA